MMSDAAAEEGAKAYQAGQTRQLGTVHVTDPATDKLMSLLFGSINKLRGYSPCVIIMCLDRQTASDAGFLRAATSSKFAGRVTTGFLMGFFRSVYTIVKLTEFHATVCLASWLVM